MAGTPAPGRMPRKNASSVKSWATAPLHGKRIAGAKIQSHGNMKVANLGRRGAPARMTLAPSSCYRVELGQAGRFRPAPTGAPRTKCSSRTWSGRRQRHHQHGEAHLVARAPAGEDRGRVGAGVVFARDLNERRRVHPDGRLVEVELLPVKVPVLEVRGAREVAG